MDLTSLVPQQAAGTINATPIPVAESDGLTTTNPLSPRTFGEAQLDLDFIFDEDECESFGSAFLKSRASDAFNSQLKDFIAPVPVNITNCGTVIIHKQTDPDEDPNTTLFGYTKTFGTDPATPNTFTLTDDATATFEGVLFGDDYTVTEDVIPAGWDFENLDCDASVGRHTEHHRHHGHVRHRQRGRRPRVHLHEQGQGHDHRREDHRRRDRVLRLHVGHPDTVAVHPHHHRGRCRRHGLGDLLRPRPGHVRRRRDGAGRLEPRLRDLR